MSPKQMMLRPAVKPKVVKIVEPDPPSITAQSYCVYDCNTKTFLLTELMHMKREVASMTKMMTFLTVIKLMKKYGIDDPANEKITITKAAAKIQGTTASL